MKHKSYIPTLALLSLSALAIAPVTAHAQTRLPRVSIHLRDRPVRAALERIFNDAGIQHAIDPQVSGFVTMKIRNQPFENALKLIMRSSTVPLTYTKENNVYIVRVLRTAPVISNTPDIAPEQPDAAPATPFNYFDPYYFEIPLPRTPIIMGAPGMGGVNFNNLGGFGAGGVNGYIGGSFGNPFGGFGGFINYPWSGFNSFGGLNGVNFGGGFVPGNFGGINTGGLGGFGGINFGGPAF